MLDSRFRGNDTVGLARQETGRVLHSDKMLPARISFRESGFGMLGFFQEMDV